MTKIFSNIVQIYFHKIHDLPCPGQARDNVPECRKALRENDGKSSNHSNFACACNFEEMPIFVLCLRFFSGEDGYHLWNPYSLMSKI